MEGEVTLWLRMISRSIVNVYFFDSFLCLSLAKGVVVFCMTAARTALGKTLGFLRLSLLGRVFVGEELDFKTLKLNTSDFV